MAKGIVVYFSQTGSTKMIAEAVHKGMSRSLDRCDIAPLKSFNLKDLAVYDLISVGSPVWVYREPLNFSGFIESMTAEDVEGKHAFAFCTHGTCPGNYFGRVVPALRQRGLTVIGWADWYCAVCLPYMPKPYYTDGHPDDIDLREAEDFGREMAERSRKIYAGDKSVIPVLPVGKEYDEIYNSWPGGSHKYIPTDIAEEMIRVRSFRFAINMEKCTKCNLCVEYCPMNSIDFSFDPPVFRPSCERCYYCEQICPVGAIEIEWESQRVALQKVADLTIAPPAVKAEAQGRFRRLVPVEEVNWDTPWYKVKGHPRLEPLK